MGCSSSCRIFERFSSALKWILHTHFKVINIVKVLDDFLFIAPTKEACQRDLDSFFTLCKAINVPVAHHKTEGPTKSLVFLGIQLDVNSMVARLPKEKLIRYAENLRAILVAPQCSLSELKSLIGKLQFATSVVPAGRPFLRRLHDATIGMRSKKI